jgi:hypothetical protein
MEDYAGNVKKDQGKEKTDKPDKNIQKVVTTEVVIQKKSLGRKIRDLIIEAEMRNVGRYIFSEVLIPAFKGVVSDAMNKGTDRMLYGERSRRGSYAIGPRVTYNSPINRGHREPERGRYGPATPTPRDHTRTRDDFILSSRDEADLVLERMNDIIETYEAVSVADLNELVGLPTTHVDNKWGWTFLGDVEVRQIREGYLIDLPQPEPLT